MEEEPKFFQRALIALRKQSEASFRDCSTCLRCFVFFLGVLCHCVLSQSTVLTCDAVECVYADYEDALLLLLDESKSPEISQW